ncbi:MAG: phenylalanine--tRNA ligase subunit beta [Aquificae bacterium]|nr:phenylalanine--tRNA ligase subunit beta [Aquificota bacterium]
MRVPYSWIKEFVDVDKTVEEVVERLNETGIEATYEKWGEYIPNIITVKIISVEKHPERDKLFVCKATDGNREYQIITGADNVKENTVAILAKEGAVIQGVEIKRRKFGSLESEGMFLSLEELGLAESSEGILLLPEDTPIGEDANKILGLGEDYIIEIEITPNRGDALSVRGLAREIGAIFGIKRKEKFPVISIAEEEEPQIEVLTNKCHRYRGIIIRNIHIKPSPWDIQLKLLKSGQNPINNVVDITNYILLQEGQPLHAFDLDKIKGKIIVRHAKEGEKIKTLDGEERQLKEGDLIIADEEKPIAIAGIIGGDNTKVDENTKNVLLEAAVFDNIQVRKTAKRLAISTDSSYRFERGVDIENLPNAQDKALELIEKTANGKITGDKDIYLKPYIPKEIKLREKTTERILGVFISRKEAKEFLNRLEIPTEETDDGTISKIPAFRALDLEREIDLVEEVGRLKGLNTFKETYPKVSTQNFRKSEEFLFEVRTRDFFKDNGLDEVVTYTFVSEEIFEILGIPVPKIQIQNYLVKTQKVMRDNLAVSLIGVLQENIRHQIKDVSIFEISSTFFEKHEEIRAGVLLTGEFIKGFSYSQEEKTFNTTEKWDFLKAKGLIHSYLVSIGMKDIDYRPSDKPYLNPYESADIYIENQYVGYIGKIHPEKADKLEIPKDTWIGELKLRYVPRDIKEDNLKDGYLYTFYIQKKTPVYKELPKFPAVKRDLAFEVDASLDVNKLLSKLKAASKFITKVELFDIYFLNKERKSVAASVEFRAEDRSLSDEEVNAEVEKILEKLKKEISNLKLRS